MVDMLVEHVPSSKKATAKKVQHDFTGGLWGARMPSWAPPYCAPDPGERPWGGT